MATKVTLTQEVDLTKVVPTVNDRIIGAVVAEIRNEAKKLSPVAAINGGTLRNSITGAVVGKGKGVIRADAFYAGYVEFGTSKMSAQPFMRPAIKLVKSRMSSIVAANKGKF